MLMVVFGKCCFTDICGKGGNSYPRTVSIIYGSCHYSIHKLWHLLPSKRTIGFPPPALKAVGKEAAKKVQVDYTRAAAEAFSTLTPEGKTFRFVLGSGQMAERDLGKKLWFLDDSRKQKVCSPFLSFALVLPILLPYTFSSSFNIPTKLTHLF